MMRIVMAIATDAMARDVKFISFPALWRGRKIKSSSDFSFLALWRDRKIKTSGISIVSPK
jgi:hypothetical protein